MTTSRLLQRLATLSMSTKWRRRRRRRKHQQQNNDSETTTTIYNDNCNYITTKIKNDFNKINKLLLITCMLLITTTTICQSNVLGAVAAAPSSSSLSSASTSGESSLSSLSALLKSGGASYNQQLPQQQLFAMLAKNNGVGDIGLSLGSGNTAALAAEAAAALPHQRRQRQRQRFLPLHEDESDDGTVDDDEYATLHSSLELAAARSAAVVTASLASASLETNGFVADDGDQYEQAERALAAAAENGKSNRNNYNSNCPRECKCLNVFFDCDKLHLERVPALPQDVQTL